MLTSTERGFPTQGAGAERFIIRGPQPHSEPRSRRIVTLTQELPERFAMEPRFPQPGRRGGSRPRPQDLGAVGVGGADTGPNGETLPPGQILVPGIYPYSRDRATMATPVAGAAPGAASAPGICGDRRGNMLARSVIGLAAATTNVGVVRGGVGPGRINQVQWWADNVLPLTTLTAALKVSEDSDSSGGFGTTGIRIRDTEGNFDVNPYSVLQVFYPNFIVPFTGAWFLKVIVDNQTAGAINAMLNASVELFT